MGVEGVVVVLGLVTPAIIFCRFCSKSAKASSFRFGAAAAAGSKLWSIEVEWAKMGLMSLLVVMDSWFKGVPTEEAPEVTEVALEGTAGTVDL